MTEKSMKDVSGKIVGDTLTIAFSNGKTLSIRASDCNRENAEYAALHGLKQKLMDAAAIVRNTDTGASATIEDKYDAVAEIHSRLMDPNGTWNKVRGDGTGTAQGTGMLVRALMEMFGKNEDDTRELLDACSDDEVKALRQDARVVALMAKYRKPNPKIYTNAFLAKFGTIAATATATATATDSDSGTDSDSAAE